MVWYKVFQIFVDMVFAANKKILFIFSKNSMNILTESVIWGKTFMTKSSFIDMYRRDINVIFLTGKCKCR